MRFKSLWWMFSKRGRLGRQLMDEVCRSAYTSFPPRLEEVRRLLDAGADVNHNDGWDSVLSVAGRSPECSPDVVRLLLERGANVEGTQRRGLVPPLVRAAHQSDNERLRLLVDAGADVNAVDEHGRTPLLELTSWADAELIEYFLTRGANPNQATSWSGNTPLHIAAIYGRDDLIGLYIRYGSDLSARTDYGLTPIQTAARLADEHAARAADAHAVWPPRERLEAVLRLLRVAEGEGS